MGLAATAPNRIRVPPAPGMLYVSEQWVLMDMRIIGLAGWSGSGKTTLITKLIPRLIARGLTVSTLKHAHHGFDMDQPGKDSFFTAPPARLK